MDVDTSLLRHVQKIPFVPIRLARPRILHGPEHVFLGTLERNERPRTASFRSARSHAIWWELRHPHVRSCREHAGGGRRNFHQKIESLFFVFLAAKV